MSNLRGEQDDSGIGDWDTPVVPATDRSRDASSDDSSVDNSTLTEVACCQPYVVCSVHECVNRFDMVLHYNTTLVMAA